MVTITHYSATWRRHDWDGLSFQILWPEIIFNEREHYLGLATCIRVFTDRKRREFAFGFRIIGFGIAFQYLRRQEQEDNDGHGQQNLQAD